MKPFPHQWDLNDRLIRRLEHNEKVMQWGMETFEFGLECLCGQDDKKRPSRDEWTVQGNRLLYWLSWTYVESSQQFIEFEHQEPISYAGIATIAYLIMHQVTKPQSYKTVYTPHKSMEILSRILQNDLPELCCCFRTDSFGSSIPSFSSSSPSSSSSIVPNATHIQHMQTQLIDAATCLLLIKDEQFAHLMNGKSKKMMDRNALAEDVTRALTWLVLQSHILRRGIAWHLQNEPGFKIDASSFPPFPIIIRPETCTTFESQMKREREYLLCSQSTVSSVLKLVFQHFMGMGIVERYQQSMGSLGMDVLEGKGISYDQIHPQSIMNVMLSREEVMQMTSQTIIPPHYEIDKNGKKVEALSTETDTMRLFAIKNNHISSGLFSLYEFDRFMQQSFDLNLVRDYYISPHYFWRYCKRFYDAGKGGEKEGKEKHSKRIDPFMTSLLGRWVVMFDPQRFRLMCCASVTEAFLVWCTSMFVHFHVRPQSHTGDDLRSFCRGIQQIIGAPEIKAMQMHLK